jgi:hypothetical protein
MTMDSKADLARAMAAGFILERAEVVPKLIGRHEDFLLIAGLGGTACDVGAVTGDAAHVFSLGGAMGAPCMMGSGSRSRGPTSVSWWSPATATC